MIQRLYSSESMASAVDLSCWIAVASTTSLFPGLGLLRVLAAPVPERNPRLVRCVIVPSWPPWAKSPEASLACSNGAGRPGADAGLVQGCSPGYGCPIHVASWTSGGGGFLLPRIKTLMVSMTAGLQRACCGAARRACQSAVTAWSRFPAQQ
jgi:hypothetical protein